MGNVIGKRKGAPLDQSLLALEDGDEDLHAAALGQPLPDDLVPAPKAKEEADEEEDAPVRKSCSEKVTACFSISWQLAKYVGSGLKVAFEGSKPFVATFGTAYVVNSLLPLVPSPDPKYSNFGEYLAVEQPELLRDFLTTYIPMVAADMYRSNIEKLGLKEFAYNLVTSGVIALGAGKLIRLGMERQSYSPDMAGTCEFSNGMMHQSFDNARLSLGQTFAAGAKALLDRGLSRIPRLNGLGFFTSKQSDQQIAAPNPSINRSGLK